MSKEDKKKRKEVNIEIARLEEEIHKIRQSISARKESSETDDTQNITGNATGDPCVVQRMEDLSIKEDVKDGKKKLSKAQRKRVSNCERRKRKD